MTKNTNNAELKDQDLEGVSGGIALLLPAVQSAREAGRSKTAKATAMKGQKALQN